MRVKMTVAAMALAMLAVVLPASASANGSRTVHVDPGESIQAAIDKAKPGTTIKLGEGIYKESVRISKSDISIEGQGRSKTKIEVPAAADVPEGAGCINEAPPPAPKLVDGICVFPEFPDNPKARCENAPSLVPGDPIVKAVDDVEISKLAVTGFTSSGVIYFCADDPVVTRVYAKGAGEAGGEYGIAAFDAEDVVFTRNLTVDSGEAGIYIGDSAHADAVVSKNVAWKNNFGLFIRDAAHGTLQKNKAFGNCIGILFLNTDEAGAPPEFQGPPIDVKDWLAKQNNTTANNRACPAGDEGGATSGVGIGVGSSIDVSLIDNGVFGNDTTEATEFEGGIVVIGEPGFKPSSGIKVGFNTLHGNAPDLFWDEQGAGNRFFANDCLTSQPDGLCEDPADDGDHGDDTDDRGSGHHKGDRHDDHAKKHKKHKKQEAQEQEEQEARPRRRLAVRIRPDERGGLPPLSRSGDQTGVNRHGMRLMPLMKLPTSGSGSPASMSGSRVSSSVKIARSWVRASDAPRQ